MQDPEIQNLFLEPELGERSKSDDAEMVSAGVDCFPGESKGCSGAPQEPRREAKDPEACELRDSPDEVDQGCKCWRFSQLIVQVYAFSCRHTGGHFAPDLGLCKASFV